MNKIIVTGGAGFIGSHLVRRLVDEGKEVIVIDNLITTLDRRYIKDLIDADKIHFIRSEIQNPALMGYLKNYLVRSNSSISEIYNLASPASVKLYTTYPEFTFDTSTNGVSNMLSIAHELGTKDVRFLETSTSECYGDPLVHPQVETYYGNVNTQCERSCYDEGKRSAEVLCYLANKRIGLNTHIARLFNVYGPNNTDDRVMPTFITQAMNGDDITIFGDGKQTRSFCYVDDIVDALIKLQATDYHSPVNLGNPHEITIEYLADTINHMFGNRSNKVHRPLPEFDPTQRCPDITLANQILDWSPKVLLTDGIRKVIDWMESQKCK